MAVSAMQSRWMIAVCGVLVVAVAAVIAFGVIPPVLASNAPGISPEDAVPAFRVVAGIHLVIGLVLLLVAALSKGRSRISTSGLLVAGIVVLLLGFVTGDAALAFLEAGASMRGAAILLFGCVAADVLVGALTLMTASPRQKIRAASRAS